MTEYIIICSAAFFASGLTLFSGFGLGTILMPVFAVFFPLNMAVALTAIVHFLNNLFKFFLLGKQADRKIILVFGFPAVLAAIIGAKTLIWFENFNSLFSYTAEGHTFYITPIKVMMAALMIGFVLLEFIPRFSQVAFDKKYLPMGGVLSGFFGGLSGHQGVLRSAFLIKCGLSKESFIATGVVIACLVDVSRIFIYAKHFLAADMLSQNTLLMLATVSAFGGAFLGARLLKKATFKTVQVIVSIMLIGIALLLAGGII